MKVRITFSRSISKVWQIEFNFGNGWEVVVGKLPLICIKKIETVETTLENLGDVLFDKVM